MCCDADVIVSGLRSRWPASICSAFVSVRPVTSGMGACASRADLPDILPTAAMTCSDDARNMATCRLTPLQKEQREELRSLTGMAARLFDVPFCSLTLLADQKSHAVAGHPQWTVGGKHDRRKSFCHYLLVPQRPEILIVPDASDDGRFRHLDVVKGWLHLRFYAGAPLLLEGGNRAGALCLLDRRPRAIDAASMAVLWNISTIAVRYLEGGLDEPCAICDVGIPRWGFSYRNTAWCNALGQEGDFFWDSHATPTISKEPWTRHLEAINDGRNFHVKIKSTISGDLTSNIVTLMFVPMRRAGDINIPASSASKHPPCTCPSASLYHVTLMKSPITPEPDGQDSALLRMVDAEIGPLLGKGGYGSVFRGMWRDTEVAIKIIRAQAQERETAWFEASVMQDLNHPGIIKCYDWASTAAGTVIVMQLCGEGSLQSAIDRGHFQRDGSVFTEEPDMQRILVCAMQIVRGIRHLHEHDIIHADLNGNNVLFDSCSGVKIVDFGLSRLLHSKEIESDEFGTVTHTPREMLVTGSLTKKVDVYSFGVLLWEMLSSRRAYAGLRYPEIVASKVKDTVRWCAPRGVPTGVAHIVELCTQRDPASRPDFSEIESMLVVEARHIE